MDICHEGDSEINIQTESSITDTTSWEGLRTLDHLVDFIIKSLFLASTVTTGS